MVMSKLSFDRLMMVSEVEPSQSCKLFYGD